MPELIVIALALIAFFAYRFFRKRQREAIRNRPFPEPWREILEQNMPLYRRLPAELRDELHGHVQLFVHDKQFYGFQGLEVTEEMRLTIAGHACLLLLNRNCPGYANFSSVYIYPSTFVGEQRSTNGMIEEVAQQARLGESWHRGPVILAWDAVLHGAHDINDGHNVVLHEFAHKLDDADGRVDGAPILHHHSHYVSWARVMQREFEQLQKNAADGVRTVMNHYGATNPAEFFAVLTETFYEKPRQLKKHHPELYTEMQKCFRVDPLAWIEAKT
ncbi:MAG: zinc-dependent peptidase [Wenzhouxiangella sp.]|nr:MAG: zinc-dependent peptidase [Wenzhouxiangella sp.]